MRPTKAMYGYGGGDHSGPQLMGCPFSPRLLFGGVFIRFMIPIPIMNPISENHTLIGFTVESDQRSDILPIAHRRGFLYRVTAFHWAGSTEGMLDCIGLY